MAETVDSIVCELRAKRFWFWQWLTARRQGYELVFISPICASPLSTLWLLIRPIAVRSRVNG